MIYKLKVEDLINVNENKSSFNLNDMIHICKRENNNKRDYLFVNKYLGKHYPVLGSKVIQLFSELYQELLKSDLKDKKILVVGFAETATAISEFITHQSIINNDLNIVYHLQTTRENIDTKIKNISFQEEHSHAINQKLYWNEDKIPEYDTILFVEDEITTGKTIINFINRFKEINKNTNFYVASILNWQNKENINKYKDLNIKTIYLVKGEIKERISKIKVNEIKKEDFFHSNQTNFENILSNKINPRLGLTREEFLDYIETIPNLTKYNSENITIIGTEEFMYKAILLANNLDTTVRSTTRSPIVTSQEDCYLIQDGIILPSFYDSKRKTFLYNIDKDVDNIIFFVESKSSEWEAKIRNIFKNKNLLFYNSIKEKDRGETK